MENIPKKIKCKLERSIRCYKAESEMFYFILADEGLICIFGKFAN